MPKACPLAVLRSKISQDTSANAEDNSWLRSQPMIVDSPPKPCSTTGTNLVESHVLLVPRVLQPMIRFVLQVKTRKQRRVDAPEQRWRCQYSQQVGIAERTSLTNSDTRFLKSLGLSSSSWMMRKQTCASFPSRLLSDCSEHKTGRGVRQRVFKVKFLRTEWGNRPKVPHQAHHQSVDRHDVALPDEIVQLLNALKNSSQVSALRIGTLNIR